MRESDIVRGCLDYLKLRRIMSWRQNAGVIPLPNGGVRFSGLRGVSDILGIWPQTCSHGKQGVFLAVEVKTDVGRVSEAQREFLKAVNDNGGLGLVVRSVDDLAKQLEEFPLTVVAEAPSL